MLPAVGLALLLAVAAAAQSLPLPNVPGSLKFAVIGDNGTGDTPHTQVGQQMTAAHKRFPFDLVIMLGDNMNGQRYYTYVRNSVRFVVIDSTQVDPAQLQWLDTTLRDAREDWTVCDFHHPLYSNAARHGSSVNLRVLLEPLFIRYGVDVVLSGHDHVYERIKPRVAGQPRRATPARPMKPPPTSIRTRASCSSRSPATR